MTGIGQLGDEGGEAFPGIAGPQALGARQIVACRQGFGEAGMRLDNLARGPRWAGQHVGERLRADHQGIEHVGGGGQFGVVVLAGIGGAAGGGGQGGEAGRLARSSQNGDLQRPHQAAKGAGR
jgi:hypothetical protein